MNVSATASPQVSLPSVNPALEPEWVRNGSAATKHAYQEGLGFEEMLTEELGKALAESGGFGGEGESEAEGGTSGEAEEGGLGAGGSQLLSSLLPHALAEGVVSGGGLGLAAQMASELGGGPGGSNAAGGGSGAAAGGSGAAAGGSGAAAGGSGAAGGGTSSGGLAS
jgi:hypothetical protein